MATRLRLLITAAVRTLCGSLLGITTFSPIRESFRFIDLPTEIRCMVYEYLIHDARVKIQNLGLPGCTADTAWVQDCYCASVMRVCQQMRNEYTAVTTPTLRLRICIGTYGVDDIRERPQNSQNHLPVLPESVLAQITRLDIRVYTGCAGRPHCDYLSTVQNIFSRMTRMTQATYKASFYIDHMIHDHPAEFDDYRAWIDRSLNFFPTMTCASACWLRVEHEIRCDLFCVLSDDDTEGPTSEVIFGVCMAPEEGTFKFHNLDLKFIGEEEVGDGDTWWHGEEDDEDDEDGEDGEDEEE